MERGEGEVSLLSPGELEGKKLEPGIAERRYNQLRNRRDTWLDRARRASAITLPYLIPLQDQQVEQAQTDQLDMPWSGIGGLGVNNLAARLVLALLPPTGGFFRFTTDVLEQAMAEAQMIKAGASEDSVAELRQETEKGLAVLENAVEREIGTTNDRVALFEAVTHLLVGGAVMLYRRGQGMKVFHLIRHCLLRDPMGNPVEAVTCEVYLYASLDTRLKRILDQVDRDRGSWQREQDSARRDERRIKVYTHIKWTYGDDGKPGKVTWHQEIGGVKVPGTEGSEPADASPWLPLRLFRVDGDSYGPGYIEWMAIADLINNEALARSVTEASMQAARGLVGRRPMAVTTKETFAAAPNGSVIDAEEKDFFPISTADVRDLNVSYQNMTRLEQRLARIFLMPDIRDSERTTAEEVRLQIQQIEQMLGSIYSILTVEFQYPYVRRILKVLTDQNRLPDLPDVKPVVSVGLAALGRKTDAEKLAQFATQGNAAMPQQFAQVVDAAAWLREFATAMGVTPTLVKSNKRIGEEQKAAMQAQQQQQLIQAGMGDPQKLANAGLAAQQMAAGPPADGQPEQPTPEMQP